MENIIIVFEDDQCENFYPLTYLRPVYFLRPGIRSLLEKILDNFVGYKPYLFCRPEIQEITSELINIPVNRFDETDPGDIIFINGRVKLNDDFALALKTADKTAFLTSNGSVLAIKITDGLTGQEYDDLKNGELGNVAESVRKRSEVMELHIPFYNYLWDLVEATGDEITADFRSLEKQIGNRIAELQLQIANGKGYQGVDFINPGNIYIAPDAEILPGNLLDASKGPIFIGTGARIEPHTYLIGPTYIGKESLIVGGRIAGSSIGPVCRVGGELEETIIQGYTNKYHAGFIGHSYMGEWVNLGAMTTNSDLKNNYNSVKVTIGGKDIDTGLLKVGSFIGDFTKTAIGTLLNTGINIGVVCNIISEGMLVTEREIPPFTWYSSRHKLDYNLTKAIETIEKTMSRRGKELSDLLRARLIEINRLKPRKT